MSGYTCPNCGHHSNVFGKVGGAKKLSKDLRVDIIGIMISLSSLLPYSLSIGNIPLDDDICELSDKGQPVVISNPQTSQVIRSETSLSSDLHVCCLGLCNPHVRYMHLLAYRLIHILV